MLIKLEDTKAEVLKNGANRMMVIDDWWFPIPRRMTFTKVKDGLRITVSYRKGEFFSRLQSHYLSVKATNRDDVIKLYHDMVNHLMEIEGRAHFDLVSQPRSFFREYSYTEAMRQVPGFNLCGWR